MRMPSHPPITALAAACLLASLGISIARAQFEPRPPKDEPPVKIIDPTVDTQGHLVSLPAAFWNQKMTNWVEVAVCGRPSDFLHETILSLTTTKARMAEAMRKAGFHDADYWVDSVADFPRVRGDRALLLLEVEVKGKKDTFLLDELLAYQNWGVTIGPYGWMFKGDPERNAAPAKKDKMPADKAPAAPAGEEDEKPSPRQEILRDDPQVALQFKGIQHLSQSFMDHPLCYDTWIYPVVRYQRNYTVMPRNLAVDKTRTEDKDDPAAVSLAKFWTRLYDSNGEVPVRLTIQKTGEEEFLTAAARYWHDEKYAAYIRGQIPVARQLDKDKAEFLKAREALKALADSGAGRADVEASNEFAKVALLAAALEKSYAALDAAWGAWAADHAVFEAPDDDTLKHLKEQARLWKEHMVDQMDRAAFLYTAEAARGEIRRLKDQKPVDAAALRKATGKELEARSEAMLRENRHPMAYWKYEESRIAPDETRLDWIKSIKAQVTLASARQEAAKAGIAYGKALQEGQETPGEQNRYKDAVTRMTLANLRSQLVDIDFEISKRKSLEGDPDLPTFEKKREDLLNQIKLLEAATQPAAK